MNEWMKDNLNKDAMVLALALLKMCLHWITASVSALISILYFFATF